MPEGLNLKIGANKDFLLKSIGDVTAQYNSSNQGKHAISIGIDTKQSSRALGQITGNVQDFDKALAASNARVIAFGASTAVLGGSIRTFRDLAQVTIDVQKAMVDVNRVFGLTGAGLQQLTTDLIEVSRVTASSFQDSSKALLEFSRQGIPAAEAIKRTNDALTLTRLTGIDASSAVESLTATVNGFSKAGFSTTQVLNKLVAVEQQFSVGAGDLSDALSRTGQAAQEAGVSLDELNALVTAAQQSTARGGAVIGNALKSIFTRIQRTETLDQLEAFNVAVRDAEGVVLPATQILKNFAAVYKDLAASQRSQLSEQIAGVYQINILKALVSDLNKENGAFTQALVIGKDATNEAAQANIALNQTLSALFSRISSGTGQLANNIGKVTFDPLAKSAGAATEQILNTFNQVLEGDGVGSGFANGILKGIRNILGGPAAIGVAFGLFKIIQTSGNYIAEIVPNLLNINTQTANRRNIEQSIFTILQQQGPVADVLLSLEGNRAAQAGFLAREVRATTIAYEQQLSVARQLAPLVAAEGVVFGKRGLITKTNSSGFIPASTRAAEQLGAYQGGYIPGKVVRSPVGGVMNTAEQVKYFAGFSQPFINPPANSKAGIIHKANSIRSTGVNPYSSDGFVPTFAGGGIPSQNDLNLIGTKLIGQSGKFVSHKKISESISNYLKSLDLVSLSNFEINNQIRSLIGAYQLKADSFAEVTKQAFAFAKAEKEARKEITSVKFGGQYGITDNVIFGGAVNRGFVKPNTSGFPLGSQPSFGVPGFSGAPNFGNNVFKGSVSGAIKSGGTPSFANESIVSKILSGSILSGPQVGIARQASLGLFNNTGGILNEGSLSSINISNASRYKQLNSGLPQGTFFGSLGDQFSGRSNVDTRRIGSGTTATGTYSGGLSGFSSGQKPPPPTSSASAGTSGGSASSRFGSGQAALALSFGGPIIAGLIEQAVFGNKSRIELSSGERFGKSALGFGATAVATGAGIGASFGGPVGAALGAGGGALIGLIKAIDATSLTFEELVSQTSELKAQTAESVNAGKNYVSTLKSLSESTDPQQRARLRLELDDALSEIKNANLAKAFRDAGEDIIKLTKALGDFESEKRLEAQRSQQTSFIKETGLLNTKQVQSLGFKISDTDALTARVTGRKQTISSKDSRNQEVFTSKFRSLFSDLSTISLDSIDEIAKELDKGKLFDASFIQKILVARDGLSENIADSVVEQLGLLAEEKNLISSSLKDNFASILRSALESFKVQKVKTEGSIVEKNTFGKFRKDLTQSILDEVSNASKFAKSVDFSNDSYNLLQSKIKEVGDNLFNSLLANASELGQFSIKRAQANFNTNTQRKSISSDLDSVIIRSGASKREAKADLRLQIDESLKSLPSLVQNKDSERNITDFLDKAALSQISNKDIGDFASKILGGGTETGAVTDLSRKLQAVVGKFNEIVTEADRAVELEKQKYKISNVILEITDKISSTQLDFDRKRLSISLAQKDAASRLQLESETKRLGATTNLELSRIQAGGEFRTLGLNKRDDFTARQSDQARIFAAEQAIDKNKALTDVRQSIIEIAAQDANTRAQDDNTEQIILLNTLLSQQFLKAATASGDRNGIGFANGAIEQNRIAGESFRSKKSLPSKTNLDDFGIDGNESIGDGIEKLKALKERFKGTLTEGVINEEINKLKIAGETLKSGATIFEAKAKQAASDFERSSGFVNNMAIGFSELSRSADDIVDKLGRQVPSSFADGIASALTRGITGAQKLGDALKDSAINFGQQILSDLLRASLYKGISATGIGAIFGQQSQRGGVIKAQNGMYISGGRTGDKNPALLEDGEYVLNRNAVKALGGKNALDTFNFEQAPRFGGRYAAGGSFGTQAEINLIRKKGQEDNYDFTGSLLSGSGASQAINADNYSAYAYGNDQYFLKQREKASQDLQAAFQKKFQSRQKNAALISTIVGAVGSLALSAGISQLGQAAALGKQVKSADGFGLTASTPEAQRALSSLSNRQLGEFVSKNTSAFQINGTALSSLTKGSNGILGLGRIGNSASAFSKLGFSSAKGSGFSLFQQGVNSGAGILTNRRQNGGFIGLNSGGFLPHGSRLGDTIPAMLTGGEFVMNNNAVRKYGIGGMNQINNGVFKAGESGPSSVTNTHNNSTNISVNIDRNGNAIVGSNDNSYEKKDMAFSKDVARSIGAIVKKKISDEKRYGGELYRNTLRS